tara:strand:+ start:1946 stop:2737 length:792 start_codon:yes stop_codon:yes gene_type:complete
MSFSLQKPLISIITPTLNNKKKLLELISNIKKQTFKNYEHIIADGGSNDGTVEYLKNKKLVDKVITFRDLNMYRGINNVLSQCRGSLVGYVNSDDLIIDFDYFKKIAANFKKHKFDCIYGGYEFFDVENKNSKSYQSLKFKKRYLVTLGMPFCQHSFFWNSKYSKMKFNTKYKVCSDFEFIGKILLKSNKIIFINSKVARFYKSKNSFGEKNHTIGIKETKMIKKNFKKRIKRFNMIYYIYDRICNYLVNFTKYDNKTYIIIK